MIAGRYPGNATIAIPATTMSSISNASYGAISKFNVCGMILAPSKMTGIQTRTTIRISTAFMYVLIVPGCVTDDILCPQVLALSTAAS